MHGNRGLSRPLLKFSGSWPSAEWFCSSSRNAFVRFDLIHKFVYQARRIALLPDEVIVRPPGAPTTPGMPGGGGPPAERRGVLAAPFATGQFVGRTDQHVLN